MIEITLACCNKEINLRYCWGTGKVKEGTLDIKTKKGTPLIAYFINDNLAQVARNP